VHLAIYQREAHRVETYRIELKRDSWKTVLESIGPLIPHSLLLEAKVLMVLEHLIASG
jgi:hypothetical protein